jgi:nitroimidazol reductase NimA-like FMN-containing flavoprotein (pyridoxamine 5'-phosphate oxidase superfamily)
LNVSLRLWYSPRTLLRANGPARSAIANARGAAAEIARSVEERTALMVGLEPAAGEGEVPAGGTGQAADERRLVVLKATECRRLLATRRLGRLAFVNHRDQPLIVPVNYGLDAGDILIASGPGPKLQAAIRGDAVAFEVDALDETTGQGWSVVVTGRAKREPRPAGNFRTASDLPADSVPCPWAPGPRSAVIRISTQRITGRWLTGDPA